ncbi:MAG: dihydrodipicolinate synthase family protein, partial [Thermomicrobiales bacterium]
MTNTTIDTFVGCHTALITPFRDGQIDEPALRALVDRQIAGGVSGLVPCGTTGEAPALTASEWDRVVATVIET